MERIASELTSWRPAFQVFRPQPPITNIELADEGAEEQISLFEDSAALNMPYFRPGGEERMRVVAASVPLPRRSMVAIACETASCRSPFSSPTLSNFFRAGVWGETAQTNSPNKNRTRQDVARILRSCI
jgi:hypothetical protein